MTRYFPEVVDAVGREFPEQAVIDGEIVVPSADGSRLDFEALLQRIHPAESRVRLLAGQTPAHFVAFDLLALGDEDLRGRPFAERRAVLAGVLAQARSPVHLTPATTDRALARAWFGQFEGAGLDGIIAKPLTGTYQPDKRVMFKIKHERTADCVVAGYRLHKGSTDAVGSLLLGLYSDGALASVGVVGAFPMAARRQLFAELQPLVTTFEGHPWDWARQAQARQAQARQAGARQAGAPQAGAGQPGVRHPREAEGSRWNAGKDLSFTPLRPERVIEVRYDHMEGPRFRHTAQFVRWRPDRDPHSCTFGQLDEPVRFDLAEVFSFRPD
jgi:bifunctional non-homologous end joining protein LigD